MTPDVEQALTNKLVALADDELILGHRHSEWTGHAPILEEDIAFANLALDELGHAAIWYSLLEDLTGDEPDRWAFFRDGSDFRNVQLVELPNRDWAFSMVRQYLFDTAEMIQLTQLMNSSYKPAAEAADKIRREEMYHVRHTSEWVKRLGRGTEESRRRMQRALDELWLYAQQLFVPLPDEDLLVAEEIVEETAVLHREWLQTVTRHLEDANLKIPDEANPPTTTREEHTDHLPKLLAEMQMVARLDPEAEW